MRVMPKGMKVNGLRVAQARLALEDRPSQADFAKRVGIHWVTQSNIENNKANVSLELLERIAAEARVTREHLLATDLDEEERLSELRRIRAELVLNGQDDLADALLRLATRDEARKVTA